jgi:amino acid adenylation domain-containing protein
MNSPGIMPNNISTDAVFLLQDFLTGSAKLHPDKTAITCGSRRTYYEELDKTSNLISHALIEMGVERGDRVLVFAGNTIETAIAFWAILKANAVVSIINPSTKADKLAYLLNDSQAKVLITEAHLASVFAEVCPQSTHLSGILISGDESITTGSQFPNRVAWFKALEEVSLRPGTSKPPDRICIDIDLAAIIYTSGSTGEPKGVMLTHRNMIAAASSIVSYLEMAEDDVVLNVFPFSFDYGLYQMIMCILSGASLILEESFAYPAKVLKRIAEENVTGFPGVPSVFSMMENMRDLSKFDFSSLRFVTNTAAALSLKNIRFLRKTFPAARIYSMYGLTECKRCSYLPPEDLEKKPLSVGVPIPNTEFWIEDEQGRRLGPNEVGMLVVRGATVMKGYWGKPEETERKLRPGPLPGELVLHTGDLCRIDEEGYLYFIGRTDDIIKTRGEKVAPKEIENVIHDIPGVREVAVTGVEDKILGQAIKAFVSLEEGCTLTGKTILAHCSGRLENFMIPKYVEILIELPKTTTGKIKKTILSELSEDTFLIKDKS